MQRLSGSLSRCAVESVAAGSGAGEAGEPANRVRVSTRESLETLGEDHRLTRAILCGLFASRSQATNYGSETDRTCPST